jgi:hypothetical protein
VDNGELDSTPLFDSHLGYSGVSFLHGINQQDAVVFMILIRQAARMIRNDPIGYHFSPVKDWLMFLCIVTQSDCQSHDCLSKVD